MSLEFSAPRALAGGWLERAVFSLDRLLRARLGIYEYSNNPQCVFRIGLARAEQPFPLPDGSVIRAGDEILELHLWNEHIPAMGHEGPTLAWARQVRAALSASFVELARYLEQHPELRHVRAICGDMHLSTRQQRDQLARIVARYGFIVVDSRTRPGALHRLGKPILIALLVLATNPAALRSAILRRQHTRLLLPRAALERRFRCDAGAAARPRSRAGAAATAS